ncbi:hypothetical protein Tco_1018072 [Tanacetum coccineum]|uniref:Uncharacterized protein n=1 Tax=Tanacetum coccineum TaxID=301880 RepID=A0ABQ5FVW0_9ASTR
MGTPTLVCVRSCPNLVLQLVGPLDVDFHLGRWRSELLVPVPLLEDPYEAIRQAYLVRTDTESEPFKDPVETEAPESPHTIAPPTSLPDSTLPTLVPILRRTVPIAIRVPLAMSPSLSTSMAEVAAMSDSAFYKRFRSSYESLLSLSPLDIPLQKRYQGTSELVEDDDDEEGDDEEEDEEMEESLDSDSVSKDAKDEGPTTEDEDPAVGDEGLAARDKGPGMGVESLSLGGDEAVPEGQPRAAPIVETAIGEPLGLGYGALRRQEIALGEGQMPSVFEKGQSSGFIPESERPERVSALRQPTLTTWINPEDGIAYIDVPAYPPPTPPAQTLPSPEWSFGSLPISPAPSIVPSPISSPMMPLTVPSLIASPATAETEGFFTESLEHEQERVVVTFRAIWRPVLALESWASQTNALRAALWHAISDTQRENHELPLLLAEERRTQLDVAKIVDIMRRGQEPRGDV